MSHGQEPEEWMGTAANPRTPTHLRKSKAAMVDGKRVPLRNANNIVWAQQGPDAHRRCSSEGVVLSAVPVE